MYPSYAASLGQAYGTTKKVYILNTKLKLKTVSLVFFFLCGWLTTNVIKVCITFANIIAAVHLTYYIYWNLPSNHWTGKWTGAVEWAMEWIMVVPPLHTVRVRGLFPSDLFSGVSLEDIIREGSQYRNSCWGI